MSTQTKLPGLDKLFSLWLEGCEEHVAEVVARKATPAQAMLVAVKITHHCGESAGRRLVELVEANE